MSLVEVAPPPSPCGIVGSHKRFRRLRKVRAYVLALPPDAWVISGGAPGVDFVAENACRDGNRAFRSYRPTQTKKGWQVLRVEMPAFGVGEAQLLPKVYPHFAAAAHARNSMIIRDLVAESGSLTAFWNGASPGTKSMIEKADQAGILYQVFTDQEEA